MDLGTIFCFICDEDCITRSEFCEFCCGLNANYARCVVVGLGFISSLSFKIRERVSLDDGLSKWFILCRYLISVMTYLELF